MKCFITPNLKNIIATLHIVTEEKPQLTFLLMLQFHVVILIKQKFQQRSPGRTLMELYFGKKIWSFRATALCNSFTEALRKTLSVKNKSFETDWEQQIGWKCTLKATHIYIARVLILKTILFSFSWWLFVYKVSALFVSCNCASKG